MTADQVIFTSMLRHGKGGYHVVSRSPGVSDSESQAVATWSPSHGGLATDAANPVSVNFFPLPSGRYAIARSREGRGEYSGRGGRQLYTRAVIFEADRLARASYQPFHLYRDALALGHLHYCPNPAPVLPRADLLSLHGGGGGDHFEHDFAPGAIETVLSQLGAGQSVLFAHPGDRLALAEHLVGRLAPETVLKLSFSTSLRPSSVRPFRLNLVAAR